MLAVNLQRKRDVGFTVFAGYMHKFSCLFTELCVPTGLSSKEALNSIFDYFIEYLMFDVTISKLRLLLGMYM